MAHRAVIERNRVNGLKVDNPIPRQVLHCVEMVYGGFVARSKQSGCADDAGRCWGRHHLNCEVGREQSGGGITGGGWRLMGDAPTAQEAVHLSVPMAQAQ